MDAVILAAGKGKRLKMFNELLPKALIPYKNEPLLDVIYNSLINFNFDNIFVLLNQEGKIIETYFKNKYNDSKLNFIYTKSEEDKKGPAITLNHFKDYVKGDFLLTVCDTIFRLEDLSIFLNNYVKNTILISTANLKYKENLVNKSNVIINNNVVSKIIEKPSLDEIGSTFCSLPLYIFNKEIFDYMDKLKPSKRNEYELQSLIQEYINDNKEVFTFNIDYLSDWSNFITIDTFEQVKKYNEFDKDMNKFINYVNSLK